MQNHKSLKECREEAQAILQLGVTSKEKLSEALPALLASMTRVKQMQGSLKQTASVLAELSEACSKYVLKHAAVLDDGFDTSAKGVMSGDITIGGNTFHFASGYDKPKRLDGDKLTQDFLEDLPKGWTKAKLELDTTGIDRLGVDDATLQEKGLFRPAKNVWSVKSEITDTAE